jgi:porin
MRVLCQLLAFMLVLGLPAYGHQTIAGLDSISLPGKSLGIATMHTSSEGPLAGTRQIDPKVADHIQPVPTTDFLRQTRLLGEWNGTREALGSNGLEISATFRADNFSNVSGGLSRHGAYMHNVDLSLCLDGEKMFGWTGTSAVIHFISNNGGTLNQSVGDAQMVSNIEAPKMTKLYEMWIQKEFLDESFSVLAGLYDLNTEFYVTRSSGLFLNGSHGIGKDISQTGKNGPSVFPNTALALRLKSEPMLNYYVQAVAIDGVPGALDDPCAASFHIGSDEGALVVAEFGFSRDPNDADPMFAKLAIGVWHFTSTFGELLPDGEGHFIENVHNSGAYLLAERMVISEHSSTTQGLAVFVRGGIANGRINKFDYHIGFGAIYTGMIAGRDEDVCGIALAHAHSGAEFKNLMLSEGLTACYGELSLELTYRVQLAPWLAVQPNIQHVIHPGANGAIGDATVVGGRIDVRL